MQSADGKRIGLLSYAPGLPATLSIRDKGLQNEVAHLVVGDSIAAALNRDGSRAVTVSLENPALQIWDTARSAALLTLPDTEGHMFGVKFTYSGRIVAGRSSGGITVWDARFPQLPSSR